MKLITSILKKFKLYTFIYASGFIMNWLKAHGYDCSLQTSHAIDSNRKPIPWYTYPFIEYLRQFDFSHARVFEFGSGNSTLFWASRCAEVISVEHNPEWYEFMRGQLPNNASLHLRNNADEYATIINEIGGEFDIIVIDGEWRLKCAQASLKHLSKHGLLILDNSDWFVDTSRYLRAQGLFQIDFSGPGPINRYAWTSSLFLNAPVNLQTSFLDPTPLTGLPHKVNEHE
jgi:hypothetical protein